MVVGIVAGTYSSIYVAAPLTEWIDSRMARKQRTRIVSGARKAAIKV
jgi:preprotein translocase subunit SecF